MEGFLNNTSNYLYGCVSSAFDVLSNTGRRIAGARNTPDEATMLEAFCNVAIDQAFKGAVGDETWSSLGSRLAYGAVGVYGGAGVNSTTGATKKTDCWSNESIPKNFCQIW